MKNGGPVVAPQDDEGSSVPLCVDLDGTLVHGDILVESLLLLARRRPLQLLCVPFWLSGGKAKLNIECGPGIGPSLSTSVLT